MKITSTRYDSATKRPMNLILEAEHEDELPWLDAAKRAAVDAAVAASGDGEPQLQLETRAEGEDPSPPSLGMPLPEVTEAVVEAAARAAHEANRAYSLFLGDDTHVAWDVAPEWQKESSRSGVRYLIERDFEVEAGEIHQAWLDKKTAEGWTHGAVKDPVAKTHPSLLPFAELPVAEQGKDMLFLTTVANVVGILGVLEDALAEGATCPSCGRELPALDDPGFHRWRWNGRAWEHDCGSWRPPA